MPNSDPPVPAIAGSTWAPLRHGAFRSLWLAVLVSNIGTWMQTVGAQWLLVDAPGASTLVALVQTASTLPVLLLALPSGVLADSFDRRRLLIAVQGFLVAVGGALSLLTAAGQMPPALLLTLTFALGVGQALTLPAWQAIIPELVPRPQLPSAAALGSISINLARSVGPAVAGLLISYVGVAAVFALNTASFLIFAVALLRWRSGGRSASSTRERFTAALRAGGRYVRYAPIVRRILLRATLFIAPASALWALLPLVASRQIGTGSSGYGLLLGALGVGAVLAAVVLPRVRAHLSASALLLVAALLYGGAMLVLSVADGLALVTVVLLPAGAAWMVVLSTVNAAMQLILPRWVRARGLAVYQVVVAGAQALGALAWGAFAQVTSLVTAVVVAGTLVLLGGATLRFWPMREAGDLNRDQVAYWPEPNLGIDPDPRDGPVVITVSYRVDPGNEEAFVEAMELVRRSRQRSGAYRWLLLRDGARPDTFVELYEVDSWEEHLRQHTDRLTGADQQYEQQARALTDGRAEVAHLLPADPDRREH